MRRHVHRPIILPRPGAPFVAPHAATYQRVKLAVDHARARRRYGSREGLVRALSGAPHAVASDAQSAAAAARALAPLHSATFAGDRDGQLVFDCHLRLQGAEYAPKVRGGQGTLF